MPDKATGKRAHFSNQIMDIYNLIRGRLRERTPSHPQNTDFNDSRK